MLNKYTLYNNDTPAPPILTVHASSMKKAIYAAIRHLNGTPEATQFDLTTREGFHPYRYDASHTATYAKLYHKDNINDPCYFIQREAPVS
jgi:hypothetical protein